jgi:hypothetical protein
MFRSPLNFAFTLQKACGPRCSVPSYLIAEKSSVLISNDLPPNSSKKKQMASSIN